MQLESLNNSFLFHGFSSNSRSSRNFIENSFQESLNSRNPFLLSSFSKAFHGIFRVGSFNISQCGFYVRQFTGYEGYIPPDPNTVMRLGRKRMNSVKCCEIKFVILFCPIICDSVGLLRMFLSCREKFFLKTEPLLCCQLVSLNNANDCNRPSTRTRQIDCKSPKALSKASPEKKAQPKPKLGHITQSFNRLPKLLTKPAMRRNARTNSFGIT